MGAMTHPGLVSGSAAGLERAITMWIAPRGEEEASSSQEAASIAGQDCLFAPAKVGSGRIALGSGDPCPQRKSEEPKNDHAL